eukprot:scaffold343651_cov41-Prasinocladus_malaysianus.AAC.2
MDAGQDLEPQKKVSRGRRKVTNASAKLRHKDSPPPAAGKRVASGSPAAPPTPNLAAQHGRMTRSRASSLATPTPGRVSRASARATTSSGIEESCGANKMWFIHREP